MGGRLQFCVSYPFPGRYLCLCFSVCGVSLVQSPECLYFPPVSQRSAGLARSKDGGERSHGVARSRARTPALGPRPRPGQWRRFSQSRRGTRCSGTRTLEEWLIGEGQGAERPGACSDLSDFSPAVCVPVAARRKGQFCLVMKRSVWAHVYLFNARTCPGDLPGRGHGSSSSSSLCQSNAGHVLGARQGVGSTGPGVWGGRARARARPECTVLELTWVAPGSWERGVPEPARSCQPGFLMPSGHVGICSLGGRDAVLWGVDASQRAGVSRGGPAVALASSRLGGGNLPAAFVLGSAANLSRWSDCDTWAHSETLGATEGSDTGGDFCSFQRRALLETANCFILNHPRPS
ncbi:uncharacterized protein LOC116583712 [Mustela erminea]|uniref:uncharacterized protein LOC116583712 n=1 Tax=Mustela erminea TaxID=36723 RepID=UPI001387168D|nr:uncharacterized protein LOC116583712 [Mustela erminea]